MAVNSITPTRFTGLASGIDTDTLIKNMMKISQLKIDREMRSRTTLQWKQDALKGVASDLKTFTNTYMSALSSSNMYTSKAYFAFNIDKSGKNSDCIDITAGQGASVGKITINSIDQLAKEATVSSSGGISKDGKKLNPNTSLKDLGFATSLESSDGRISFSINGKSFEFTEDDTLQKVMDTVNKDSTAGVVMSYSQMSDKISIRTKNTGADQSITISNGSGNLFGDGGVFGIKAGTTKNGQNAKAVINGIEVEEKSNTFTYDGVTYTLKDMTKPKNSVSQLAEAAKVNGNKEISHPNALTATLRELGSTSDGNGKISFIINGKTFEFNEDDTLQMVMDEVNGSSFAGVNMSFDNTTGKISIQTKKTGDDQNITITNISGSLFGDSSVFGIEEGTTQNGKNAKAMINGHYVEEKSNTFVYEGFEYNLSLVTNTNEDVNAEPITVTLTQNVDAVVDKIKTFIDGYNTMIGKLQTMLTESKTAKERTTYVPLTDEEKSGMSEEQINEWETMAKKGLLRSDSGIRGLLTQLRGAFYDAVEGAGLSPAQIGLQTSWNYRDGGKIEIDENKLRTAIAEDPNAVASIFTDLSGVSASEDSSTRYKQNGLLNRMTDIISNYTKTTQDTTLNSLERSLSSINTRIDSMSDKMYALEEKYYLQFAAMETAFSKIQSQGEWLSSMLGTNS